MKRILVSVWLLAVVVAIATADTVTGVVERISGASVTLAKGGTFNRHPNVAVKLPSLADGSWSDIKVGDQVELESDGQGRVYRLWIKTRASAGRFEQSLYDLHSVSGGFKEQPSQASISGRTFARAGLHEVYNHESKDVVYRLDQPYDELSVWVGYDDEYAFELRGQIRITIKVDDEVAYTSEPFSRGDKAEHVVIPLTGANSITFITTHVGVEGGRSVFGDPVLSRLPKQGLRLLTPQDKATVTERTDLSWQKAPGATGYLLELQCVTLSNPGDADRAERFISKRLSSQETSFSFDPARMPRGTWRWRVHALSVRGFLAELKDWRTFVSK